MAGGCCPAIVGERIKPERFRPDYVGKFFGQGSSLGGGVLQWREREGRLPEQFRIGIDEGQFLFAAHGMSTQGIKTA